MTTELGTATLGAWSCTVRLVVADARVLDFATTDLGNNLWLYSSLILTVTTSTVIGLIWRASTGRSRVAHGEAHDFATGRAALLQFSTDVCAPCVSTHALLERIAGERQIDHIDVDVTHRPDIANRFNLLQSPTTLVLDAQGNIHARIGGAPRQSDVLAALETIAA